MFLFLPVCVRVRCFVLYVTVLMGSDLFAQFICRYGEIVDVNLIRDKGTGKSKGFAFVAYEDQRSTNLAVGQSNVNIRRSSVLFL